MQFLLPSELDDKPLIRFLEEEGIERWRSESLVNDVRGAVVRYAQVEDRDSAKIQLEKFLAAAKKLETTFAPVGSIRYVQLYKSIAAQTVPRGSYDRGEALRALESLPMALVCRSARKRLDTLKPSHRPRDPKLAFVKELAQAWTCRTGGKLGTSGNATWNKPNSPFGRFVKVAACMLPSKHSSLEKDLAVYCGVPPGCQNPSNKSEVPTLHIESSK